ncbi:MAG: protein-export chaperone SecB [Rickettsiales bacterium]|nr:protein-export chaperone SecB [Rickettsiales bacterium]
MSNVKIISQYIKDLSFNIKNTPNIFLKPTTKPNIALSIDIDAKKISNEKNTSNYEITLKITAKATKDDDEKFFTCNVEYAGIFNIGAIEGDMLEQVLLIYCPNLLFPFVRRIITNISTDAGLAPLMLDPIDFALLYNRRKQATNSQPISDTKN